jgi:hypothetical protein
MKSTSFVFFLLLVTTVRAQDSAVGHDTPTVSSGYTNTIDSKSKTTASSNGPESGTRWLLDFETGSESALGYKLPHLLFALAIEKPVGKFEIQGRMGYSPDKKYITNDGNSLRLKSSALYWITQRFAITSNVERSSLWTSQFSKNAIYPSFGVAIRENWGGGASRFYVDYLIPTGCQWGAGCPIQSSRLQGPEIYWEFLMSSHLRLGIQTGVFHILEQSNELRPDIPRVGSISGESLLLLRYEFHGRDVERPY